MALTFMVADGTLKVLKTLHQVTAKLNFFKSSPKVLGDDFQRFLRGLESLVDVIFRVCSRDEHVLIL